MSSELRSLIIGKYETISDVCDILEKMGFYNREDNNISLKEQFHNDTFRYMASVLCGEKPDVPITIAFFALIQKKIKQKGMFEDEDLADMAKDFFRCIGNYVSI